MVLKSRPLIFPIFLSSFSLFHFVSLCSLFFRNVLILTWTFLLSHSIKLTRTKSNIKYEI
jgi:hypothetical protein